MPWSYTVQIFGKQQPDFFSNRCYLVITLVQLYRYTHVCENVNTSATFLGKDVSTITFSACNAVWLTTIHTKKNYQKGLNYTTIKSTSAVSLISAVKCTYLLISPLFLMTTKALILYIQVIQASPLS